MVSVASPSTGELLTMTWSRWYSLGPAWLHPRLYCSHPCPIHFSYSHLPLALLISQLHSVIVFPQGSQFHHVAEAPAQVSSFLWGLWLPPVTSPSSFSLDTCLKLNLRLSCFLVYSHPPSLLGQSCENRDVGFCSLISVHCLEQCLAHGEILK